MLDTTPLSLLPPSTTAVSTPRRRRCCCCWIWGWERLSPPGGGNCGWGVHRGRLGVALVAATLTWLSLSPPLVPPPSPLASVGCDPATTAASTAGEAAAVFSVPTAVPLGGSTVADKSPAGPPGKDEEEEEEEKGKTTGVGAARASSPALAVDVEIAAAVFPVSAAVPLGGSTAADKSPTSVAAGFGASESELVMLRVPAAGIDSPAGPPIAVEGEGEEEAKDDSVVAPTCREPDTATLAVTAVSAITAAAVAVAAVGVGEPPADEAVGAGLVNVVTPAAVMLDTGAVIAAVSRALAAVVAAAAAAPSRRLAA